jgi:aspartate aminotransferase-like enzyme
MGERKLLMIPGPTNVDPAVLRALSRPTLAHTDSDFVEIFKETLENLKKVFMTKSDVFVIAGSGTVALEMAVANVIEPGDKILNTVAGFFGDYFVKISKVHGAEAKVLEVPWGKCVSARELKKLVKSLLDRGEPIERVAEKLKIDLILAWAITLDGKDDLERFKLFGKAEYQDEAPRIYNVWNFARNL